MGIGQKGLLEAAIEAAVLGGSEILKVYESGFDVEYKQDRSPLTEADKKSSKTIIDYLKCTGIPVLSEEGKSIPYEERKSWKWLWLVDPLDGTKEFIKRNGEFTVNIALIREQKPVLGVIHVPVLNEIYFSSEEFQSYKFGNLDVGEGECDLDELIPLSKKLPVLSTRRTFSIVASRSHMNPETEEFIKRQEAKHRKVRIISKGSALKMCMVAEGEADYYPRFGLTMEWDTAAGHAIIKYAGGEVVSADRGEELVYNKESLTNPWFLARYPKAIKA